ncbi:MAG: sigma 54-interacting transcriptional regulator, partial [Polyangiaceae bacterium]|nr:sigma 54-interacting transcriptional regulator [Polyangiaceae bacterium]
AAARWCTRSSSSGERSCGDRRMWADATVNTILDADYFARAQLSLADLEKNPEFPQFADTAPYRQALCTREQREAFFLGLDVRAPETRWLPHLRALDELLVEDAIASHVQDLVAAWVAKDVGQALQFLQAARGNAELFRVGKVVAAALRKGLQTVPAATRAGLEEVLLAWAIEHQESEWDVDPEASVIRAADLQWRVEDLALETLPAVLWKLVGVLDARLRESKDDASADLAKYHWCVAAAKALPSGPSRSPAALRLVAAGQVPLRIQDGNRVLKESVSDLRALDDAVLTQFGLPLWPDLVATPTEDGIRLSNRGVGAALAISVTEEASLLRNDAQLDRFDLPANESIALPVSGRRSAIALSFEKFHRRFHVIVPVVAGAATAAEQIPLRNLRTAITRKRLQAARGYRAVIDPKGIVVGLSPALISLFESIHHANSIAGLSAVLLLGERGVGKSHIARLIHDSSPRTKGPFVLVQAGGTGGDVTIQRGEWIGYSKGHGIAGIDPKGKPGHLMEASGGTLFIDEFGDFSKELQSIFLSVLEGRGIQKVGAGQYMADVRCIFATNVDVDEAVANGVLRPDLLDRIAVKFCIPPLRERRGDILLLARHFAPEQKLSEGCALALLRFSWPGNVRELKNVLAVAEARKEGEGAATIKPEHLDIPSEILTEVGVLDNDECRAELWRLADEIAREEGLEEGGGLQRRAGEIMGVGEAQASKAYQAYGLRKRATA